MTKPVPVTTRLLNVPGVGPVDPEDGSALVHAIVQSRAEAANEARHAVLAEVRRGVDALWQERGWSSIEDSAAKQSVLRILDAAETP